MQNIQVLVFPLVLVFAVLRSCEGIQCHQCNTYVSTPEDPQCEDPYIDDYMDDCESDDTHCVKMENVATQVDTELGGLIRKKVISRYCQSMPDLNGDKCYTKVGSASLRILCFCGTDGCNAGPINKPFLVLVTMIAFVTMICSSIFTTL